VPRYRFKFVGAVPRYRLDWIVLAYLRAAIGNWSRERLLAMDANSITAMDRAIKRGLERPPEDPARAA